MPYSVDYIARGSQEWHYAWEQLAAYEVNRGLADPGEARNHDCHEVWQYMGTVDGFHEFRHRCHPTTGRREYVRVAQSGPVR